jgi:hypothetical protein
VVVVDGLGAAAGAGALKEYALTVTLVWTTGNFCPSAGCVISTLLTE